MKEIQKPNDMFVANINSPNAGILDLLQNNIHADNTSFLTPDEYKATPYIKKHYNKDGVFDEESFNKDYLSAYNKYTELADAEAADNLNEYLTYVKNDRYKPKEGRVWEASTEFKKLKNPMGQSFSVEGINVKSEPVWTPEELAQSNYIFDPETQQFSKETPESMPLYKKMFGETLVYAKWEDEGFHKDLETGEEVVHHKGEWKTDKNGNYYTEKLGDRELLDKQVVALGDILTDEGSIINKVDFFDSDGYDKSGWGIFTKAVLPMALCVIPGGKYYVALSTIGGLASTLPTFYKAAESIFTGEEPSVLSKNATKVENWFRKWDKSKSYKGRESFFTWESAGELVSDVFMQLYQQRVAASAAKWFVQKPTKLAKDADYAARTKNALEEVEYMKKLNTLGGKLNLGYMSLISASDVYNDALKSGYDRTTAGITALASAAALYGVMNFNETTRGIGNWMLDKTTGYSPELQRGTVRKLAKDLMKEAEKGVKAIDKGASKEGFKGALRKFADKLDDALVIGGEDIWKRSLIEGVEEVSEEVIQDSIKGIVDALSALGVTGRKGSFGGFSNVFSAEGAERYLATFLGGAVGGGIFAGQQKIENKFFNSSIGKQVDYTIDDAIIDGRYQELIAEVPKLKKFFNRRQTATLGEIDGESITMSVNNSDQSQSEVIAQQVLNRINTRANAILRLTEGAQYNPQYKLIYKEFAKQYKDSGFDTLYVQKKWNDLVHEITEIQSSIETLQEETKEGGDKTKLEQLTKQQELLKTKQQELHNWQNGVRLTENTLGLLVYLNPTISKQFLVLDEKSFTQDILGKDFDKLPPTAESGKMSQAEAHRQWLKYREEITKEDIVNSVDRTVDIIKKMMPTIANPITDWVKNENAKNWLISTPFYDGDGELITPELASEDLIYTDIIDYLNNNPKFWSLYDATRYDLAQALIDDDAIELDDYSTEEQEIVKNMINQEAQSSGITTWNVKNLETLIDKVNTRLLEGADNDIYVESLKEKKSKSNGTNAQIDVKLTGIKTNKLSKISQLTQKIRLNSILDVVEFLPFIDQDLYRMLEQAFSEEQLVNLKDIIKKTLNAKIGDGVEKIFAENYFNTDGNILVVQNIDGSGTNIKLPVADTSKWTTVDGILADQDNFIKFVNELDKAIDDSTIIKRLIPSSFAFDPSDLVDLRDTLKPLAEKIQNFGILPPEVKAKWDIIKNKTQRENPLYKIIKDVCHKFGVNNDSLIDFIWQKEDEVRDNITGNYSFSDADLESFNDIVNAIDFTIAMLTCVVDKHEVWGEGIGDNLPWMKAIPGLIQDITSFNGVVRNAILTGNDTQHKLEDFPIFSRAEIYNVHQILLNLKRRVQTFGRLTEEQLKRDNADDKLTRDLYNKNLCLSLSQMHLELPDGEEIVITTEKDIDADHLPEKLELFVEQSLTNIADAVNKWVDKQEDKSSAMKAVIESLGKRFPKAWQLEDSIRNYLSEENHFISDSLQFAAIIRVIACSPKTVNEKFIQGLENKNLIPRLDQEFEIKDLIAKNLNPNVYRYATTELYTLLKSDNSDPLILSNKLLLADLSNIQGGAGAGKSTTIQIVVDALKPKNVVLVAPTQDKLNDALQLEYSEDRKVGRLTIDFFGNEKIINEINNQIQNIFTGDSLKSITENKDPLVAKNITIKIDDKNIKLDLLVEHDGSTIKTFHFSDESVAAIGALISEDFLNTYENSIIFIDESTNLSQIELALLENIAMRGKSKNIQIITLGDRCQLGQTVSMGEHSSIMFNNGISQTFMHTIPELNGKMRFKNTGRTYNVAITHAQADKYSKNERDYTLSPDGADFAEVREFFKLAPLKYNGLMGDFVAKTDDTIVSKLKEMSDAVNGKKKGFLVILNDISEKNEAKNKLKIAGFNDVIVNDDNIYRTVQTIQGAEAEYVYIHSLNPLRTIREDRNDINIDIHLRRLYTALTRSKEFTLINGTEKDNLFNAYNIHSIETKSVSPTSASNYNQLVDKRIQELKNINDELSTARSVSISEEATTTIEENSDVADDEVEISENDEDDKDEGESEPKTKYIPKFKGIFNDAVEFYGYYNRLGITPAEMEELKMKKSTADVDSYMRTLQDKAKEDDKKLDLLGFWKEGRYKSGQDLLTAFLRTKNEALYTGSGDLYLSLRVKGSEDTTYLKPNNNTKLEPVDGSRITTVVAKHGDGYITLGRIGINKKGSENHLYSKTLADNVNKIVSDTGDTNTYYWKIEEKPNKSKEKREEYKKARGSETNGRMDNIMRSEFIPISGLRDFKIDDSPQNNSLGIDKEELQFGRMTVANLRNLGYNITPLSSFKSEEEFLNVYNNYRIEPLSKEGRDAIAPYWNKRWAIVTPIGVAQVNNANNNLVMIQRVSNNTMWDNIRLNLTKSGKIRSYDAKQIISYLMTQSGYKNEEFKHLYSTLSKKLPNGEWVKLKDAQEKWDLLLDQFINDLDHPELFDESKFKSFKKSKKDLKKCIEQFKISNLFQKDGTSYKLTMDEIKSPLKDILQGKSTKKWMFAKSDGTEKLQDDDIVTRCFEAPKGIIDFEKEFNLSPVDQLDGHSVTITEETEEESNDDSSPIENILRKCGIEEGDINMIINYKNRAIKGNLVEDELMKEYIAENVPTKYQDELLRLLDLKC